MLKSAPVSIRFAFNRLKFLYLLFALAGSLAPWFLLLQDPAALASPSLFLQRAFTNPIAAAVTTDLLISAALFLCFVWLELKRLRLSRLWLLLYVGLTFGIGLSCSLPCFLYHRETVNESQTRPS
jgi:hypothetical protein